MIVDITLVNTITGVLALIIVGLLLGKVCARYKIPEIIGYVIAGIILGPYAIGGMIPLIERPLLEHDEIISIFWHISGIIILFSAGLHFTFADLKKAGLKAAVIGILGVIVPLMMGYGAAIILGLDWTVAIIIGATLSATSIAISVLVLEELKKEKTVEGNILVNAAVIDDVIGLAILSAVVTIVTSKIAPDIITITTTTVQAIGFWLILLIAAVFLLPKIIHLTGSALPTSLESRATKQTTALGSAFGLAAIAAGIGLNPIVGAFAAGMGLASSRMVSQIREFVGRLKVILAPLFFGLMGTQVDLSRIFEIDWMLFSILLAIAISSKIIGSGIPAIIMLRNKTKGIRIGVGMIARGEIAFVHVSVAGIGFVGGIINSEIYSTMIFVILATIFISPELLRKSFAK